MPLLVQKMGPIWGHVYQQRCAVDSGPVGIRLGYEYQDSASERSTRRRKRLLGKIRNVCPHIIEMDLVQDGADGFALHFQPAFETRVGTLDYTCMRCGLRVSEHATEVFGRRLERSFQSDPSGTITRLHEDQVKTTKLIEKLNRRGGTP